MEEDIAVLVEGNLFEAAVFKRAEADGFQRFGQRKAAVLPAGTAMILLTSLLYKIPSATEYSGLFSSAVNSSNACKPTKAYSPI